MGKSPNLTLDYVCTRDGKQHEEVTDRFDLVRTCPYFGGVRWWILCRCGRRAGQLCKPAGASRFLCRRCYQLGYECQCETPEWRAYRRVEKIANRLSPEWAKDLVPADVLDGRFLPPKPKWMRWRTYEALSNEAKRCARLQQAGALRSINRIVARMA